MKTLREEINQALLDHIEFDKKLINHSKTLERILKLIEKRDSSCLEVYISNREYVCVKPKIDIIREKLQSSRG